MANRSRPTAEEIIHTLGLQPLPGEGGYYRETYRSTDQLPGSVLPPRYGMDKSAGTAIFYLLTADTFSALHRLKTDEIFHFYLGDPVHMLQLGPDGQGRVITLGQDLPAGHQLQVLVPRGVWQGSMLAPGGAFALLGTTMAPGFDFADYEAGERGTLQAQYPSFAGWIERLAKNGSGPGP
ncbi:MAG: cupin domain-containing protein [Planctomycetes bacterium]|nr:cupin domain-containing protein [Planctomycetota bacterium]